MEWPFSGRERELRLLERALREGDGALLAGDAGVGKTRLARELTERETHRGQSARWVVGTSAARSVPLGALAHLLPSPLPKTTDRLQLLRGALEAIVESEDHSMLVVVDDAHLLDELSLALLPHLVNSEHCRLLLTVRRGDPIPETVISLWRDGLVDQIEIGPLSRSVTEELISAALPSRVSGETRSELWRLSQGNPLLLRELILGAQETGVLREERGVWHHQGPLARTGRVAELVEARLMLLGAGEREAMEVLAVSGPLELAIAEALTEEGVVASLERQGLVGAHKSRERVAVELAHPLYGEALRSVLPASRGRELARDLADALETIGGRRREDLLRVARWRLDSGTPGDATTLVRAARRAMILFDPRLAERLARAAIEDGGAVARTILGEALAIQGRAEEAEIWLEQAYRQAEGSDELARATLLRIRNLARGLHRPDEAMEVGHDALDRLEEGDAKDELTSELSLVAAMLGDFSLAVELGARVIERPGAGDHALAAALTASTLGQVMLGRFEEAEEPIARGLAVAERLRDELPHPCELLSVNQVTSHLFQGRITEAIREAQQAHQRTFSAGQLDLAAIWMGSIATAELLAGDVHTAIEKAKEAVDLLAMHDFAGMLPSWIALWALATAHAGKREEARRIAERIDRRLGEVDARVDVWLGRAEAWLAALEGEPAEGARLAADTGRRGIENQHCCWAIPALHDAVRLGHPELIAEQLAAATKQADGDLFSTMAEHATALAGGDASGLLGVSRRFERMGALLYAAEAAGQAAEIWSQRDPGRAARAATRRSMLARRCHGARTPGVVAGPRGLTARELEIAQLAAEGKPSRDIASDLGLSVRTVDNHLGSVYAKLGIHSRHQLPTALGARTEDQEDRKLGLL